MRRPQRSFFAGRIKKLTHTVVYADVSFDVGSAVLHLITNCTARKRSSVHPAVKVGDLGRGSDTQRAQRWVQRLSARTEGLVPATDLYAGDHWSTAMSLVARHDDVRLWVVSAGYGLVPSDSLLHPYHATFSLGQVDSVSSTRSGQQTWWKEVNAWAGPSSPSHVGRTTLADLVNTGPVLAALSQPYLWPLAPDLLDADQSQVMLVSTGCDDTTFAPWLLPVAGSARMALGGSLVSVNIRVALHLLDDVPRRRWSRRNVSASLDRLRMRTPALPTFDRRPLDDDAITEWIRQRSAADPTLSATRGLTLLRAEGYACEQRRFGGLFRALVKGGLI